MKKILTIVLTFVVLIVLAACGSKSPSSTDLPTSSKEEVTESKPTVKDSFKGSIEEVVLVDESGVKITAKKLEYSSWNATLSLSLENNTDKELSFHAGSVGYSVNSVNGYMVSDGYLWEAVAPGMTANEKMNFSLDELRVYGITDIADLGVGFSISDDDYNEVLVTGPIHIKTSSADSYDLSKDTFKETMKDGGILKQLNASEVYAAEDALFNESGFKCLYQEIVENKDGEKTLFMEVENTSSEDVFFTTSNVLLNGVTASSGIWSSDYVEAGKRAVLDITMDSVMDKNEAEAYGITEFKEIAFDLAVRNSDSSVLMNKHIDIPFNGTGASIDDSGDVLYDANGIKLISKGLKEDSSKYSDDLHFLIMIKNDSGQEIYVSTDFGDTYVNKTKVSDITFGETVASGQTAILDMELMVRSLKENGLTIDNITSISTKLVIRDEYFSEIDTAAIEASFNK